MSVSGGTSTVSPKRPKKRTAFGDDGAIGGNGHSRCSSQGDKQADGPPTGTASDGAASRPRVRPVPAGGSSWGGSDETRRTARRAHLRESVGMNGDDATPARLRPARDSRPDDAVPVQGLPDSRGCAAAAHEDSQGQALAIAPADGQEPRRNHELWHAAFHRANNGSARRATRGASVTPPATIAAPQLYYTASQRRYFTTKARKMPAKIARSSPTGHVFAGDLVTAERASLRPGSRQASTPA